MGALEQIGTNFEPFLQFILEQKPSLFVHVDSILEWYDENSLMDYLAAKFCRKRKYLEGYSPRLEQLEKEAKIEILKKWRSPFRQFLSRQLFCYCVEAYMILESYCKTPTQ